MQLQVVRECQNELVVELSDYKDKYAEILELLHETQETVKEQNKKSLPTSRGLAGASGPPSRMASQYHPDSLASELELSSLGSESWPSEISTPKSLGLGEDFFVSKCCEIDGILALLCCCLVYFVVKQVELFDYAG